MVSPIRAVLIVAIIVTQVECQVENLFESFDKINDLLVKHLPNDESATENLRLARRLLIFEERHPTLAIIHGLRKFVALTRASRQELICTIWSIIILKENDRLTHEAASTNPQRRIEIVINQMIREHIRVCPQRYEEQRIRVVARHDETVREFIRLFVDKSIQDSATNGHGLAGEMLNFALNDRHAMNAIAAMRELSARQPDGARLEPEFDPGPDRQVYQADKVRQLYDQHIKANCQSLLDSAGKLFDAFESDVYTKAVVAENEQFMIDYNRFRVCKRLVSNEAEPFFDLIMTRLSEESGPA